MRHAQPCFSILGGQHPVICEHCNICTVTGEGTSFWNIVRHSFTTNFILVVFLREVSIWTQGFFKHNQVRQKAKGPTIAYA